MKTLLTIISVLLLISCAPMTRDLAQKEPIDEFTVSGNYRCLYYECASYVGGGGSGISGGFGIIVERFRFYLNDATRVAYFQQPHTLIKITAIDDNESLVIRKTVMTTPNPDSDGIIRILKSNPCRL
jgi:hypothetical protein